MVFQESETKLSRPLFRGSILENDLVDFRSYWISWAFQNRIFHFFANFSVTKLKLFFLGKVRKTNQNFLNSKLFIVSIFENGFEAALRSKPNFVNLWKCRFSVFWKFLSRKAETVFRKVRQNVQKCLNKNLVLGSILENGFEATSS